MSGYAVFDRPDGASLAKADADVMAIRYIEPLASNAAALGINQLSVPAARSKWRQNDRKSNDIRTLAADRGSLHACVPADPSCRSRSIVRDGH